jgi:dipeptidyl aminopeptidase/acylaminoacyl peptidase
MKKTLFLFLIVSITFILEGQKPPLDHSVYDGWKSIGSSSISDDGKWVTYEINPQQGDGWLYFYNVAGNNKDSAFCGTRALISSESRYIAYQVKPTYAETRLANKKKLKPDQMPKNNLCIRLTGADSTIEIKRVKSYDVPRTGSYWMAYLLEKSTGGTKDAKAQADTAKSSALQSKSQKKTPEPKGTELVIFNPVTFKSYRFSDVTEYVVARDGKTISFLQDFPDSTKVDKLIISQFDTRKETTVGLFEGKGTLRRLSNNFSGDLVSFIFTQDTSKVKIFDLFLSRSGEKAGKIVDSSNPAMPSGWSVSENSSITFSEDGTRLFFGTAEKPVKEPEDTLLANEKYKLDIWSWDDDVLQPMQKIQLDEELKRTYQAVYHTDRKVMFQLATKEIPSIRAIQKGNNDLLLGVSDIKYRKESSWDASNYSDYYIINVETGTRKLVLEKNSSTVSLSPDSKYLVYWSDNDQRWFSINTSTGDKKIITSSIPIPLFDELNDMPDDPRPYGIAGWTDDSKHILIYDRYDIWSVDLAGQETPLNITNGFGRKNELRLRLLTLDREEEFVKRKEPAYLSAFNYQNKEAGFFTLKNIQPADPTKLTMGKYSYNRDITKAKKSDKIIWERASFVESPELFVSDLNFTDPKKISVTNPQQKKYNWGTAELFEWTSFDRQKLQGILYKPEDFDPAKKYPMIVYFYERNSDVLYNYFAPSPSASIINRTFAVSNGYLVFVPDIPYDIGYPGQSCYDAVISGTYALIDKYSYIDKQCLALDGQSWGGYQIAYLVTRTDLFACAYAGAPVVNMISAYGGIRWESGMSRMFQYEETQSRIGGTFWEKPMLFIENSPIFEIPRIKTPLLIMANDADGAVPWYQGIEFITALRRLGKPAWLLSYNDEAHNLVKRPNRKDITIRKMQFFDHYLKGAPMPYWMKYGISQSEKGKKDGYELVNE